MAQSNSEPTIICAGGHAERLYPGMNDTGTSDDITEPVTHLPLLLEDTLLHINELQHVGSDTAEILELRAYAATLRAAVMTRQATAEDKAKTAEQRQQKLTILQQQLAQGLQHL